MKKQIKRVIHVNFDPSQQQRRQEGIAENPLALCAPDLNQGQGVRPMAMYATAPTAADVAAAGAYSTPADDAPTVQNVRATPTGGISYETTSRTQEGPPLRVYVESSERKSKVPPYYVLNRDRRPVNLAIASPSEPGRPGHIVGSPGRESLFLAKTGGNAKTSVTSGGPSPPARRPTPGLPTRLSRDRAAPRSYGSYFYGDSLGPNCRLVTSRGMVKGCLCGEEDLVGGEEYYPIDYKKMPEEPPLITWKKKKMEKYGTLLVQRGRSNMVVKIPVHDHRAADSDEVSLFNFVMVLVLLGTAMVAYVY